MKIIIRIGIFIMNLIFMFMKVLPVRNKVTFISRQSDEKSEDMVLLEAAISCQDPHVHCVFLCRKLKVGAIHMVCYGFHVVRQMYHIATSKVVILDSYCAAVSVLKQRAHLTVIQMWHALGALKKFGLSIVGEVEGRSHEIAETLSMHKNYTYVFTSGSISVSYFAEAFGYDEKSVKVMSLPRVDRLKDKVFSCETISKIRQSYPDTNNKKLVIYAPTFRKNRDISREINHMAQLFNKEKYVFILKKHPLMEVNCNCCIVDEKFSTLEMIMAADYVICDYSAVIFEAAILEKPLFFYTFDYEDYGAARDFYIDYIEEMPGVISSSAERLVEAIEKDEYDIEKIRVFAHKYIENTEECAKKMAKFVIDCLKKYDK